MKPGPKTLVVPHDRSRTHEVDDAAEILFCPQGKLQRNGLSPKPLPDLGHYTLKISPHAIHFIHERDPRDAVLVGLPPHRFRLRLYPPNATEHSDGAIEHTQRTFHLDGEVHVAWGIDDVDPVVPPKASRRGGRNGDSALLLLYHPVHGCSSLMDLADFVRHPRVVQNPLRGRGLTGIDVRHDANVSRSL
ncbi:hypothetical protein HRbin30_02597 [bacterium HR30]|nr:hypothetical protein HRbin30_02597 [bacterium HR30]